MLLAMNGSAYIIIPPASGRCNLLLDPLRNNCTALLSNRKEKQGSEHCLCRYIELNRKRSWIKIRLLVHILPPAIEPDNGSLLWLMAVLNEDLFGMVTVDDERNPSDDRDQDIVCVQIQIEYSACVSSFHFYAEVAHFSCPSFSHFAALMSF